MKFYEFINSKDIREHCRKINYRPDSLECAYLIWQSRGHTIEQKHKAYEWIISFMPDAEIKTEERSLSLHEYLKTYIKIEDSLLSKIAENKNSVYTYRNNAGDYVRFFNDKNLCIKDMQAYCASFPTVQLNLTEIFLMQSVGERTRKINQQFNEKFQCAKIEEEGVLTVAQKEIFELFKSFHIDVPIPFKTGDCLIESFSSGEEFFYDETATHFDKGSMSMILYEPCSDMFVEVENYLNIEYVPKYHSGNNKEKFPF